MKKILVILLSVFCIQSLFSQERAKFDFIVTVDEKILKTLSNPEIIVKDKDDTLLGNIKASYYPGNFSIDAKSFNDLISKKNVRFYLKFQQYDYSKKGRQNIRNYEIEIGKNWFEQQYLILNIYNLDVKKYKGYTPLSKNQNYTFELDTSNGQMIRAKN